MSHYKELGSPYIISYGGRCHNNKPSNEETNNHEEADTLIIRECLKCEPGGIIDAFSPDTDLMVLLIARSSKYNGAINMMLSSLNKVDIKLVAASLGKDVSLALMGLVAITGSNTTGKSHQKGKTTWFKNLLKTLLVALRNNLSPSSAQGYK